MAMATASQSALGLQVTAPDDDMEMTSEFHRAEDDIDIDLDLGGDYPPHDDDDLMLEDARSEAGHEQHQPVYQDNDDVMLDDELDGADGMIQDNQDNLTIPDEHLTDVSEIGHEEAAETNMSNRAADPDDVLDFEFDDEIPKESDEADPTLLEAEAEYEQALDALAPTTAEQEVREDVVAETAPPAPSPPQSGHEQPLSPIPPTTEPALDNEVTSSNHVAAEPTQNEEYRNSPSAHGSPGEKQNNQDPATSHENSGSPHVTQNAFQEPTHPLSPQQDNVYQAVSSPLHPVIVIYHENQISLFPPREEDESQTFFLQDESIAHQSIYELLQACRTVLGDTIRDEEELEMDIAELGLCISEDCTFAPTVSFSQILDTYTLLNQQDGVHEPDPLYMTLTTKTRFSSRFNQLNAAAIQGKGISQLTFLGQPDEDDVEYATNEAAENEHSEQNDTATHEQDQQNVPDEGLESKQHDAYAQYSAQEPHSPEQEADGNETYESAETKLDDLLDLDNQADSSAQNATTENDVESGSQDNGATENDASVTQEQDTGEPEHEAAAPESHDHALDEEDLIDYSDDEEDADQTHVEDSGSGPSSGSSTVQDDAALSPKDAADAEAENQTSHFEDGLENLGEFDEFESADADAATLDGHPVDLDDTVQLQIEGEELDQEVDQELEKKLEQELENKGMNEAAQDVEAEAEQTYAYDDVHHDGSTKQEAEYEFGESFDDNYAPDFEGGQYSVQEMHDQAQEHDFEGQESYETHGDGAADNGDADTGLGEVNYEDGEHGDFDYPEFNDEQLSKPTVDDAVEAGNESDSIDYDDDEEDESAPTAPTTGAVRASASPPNKRSRDEQDDDDQDLRKKTRLD